MEDTTTIVYIREDVGGQINSVNEYTAAAVQQFSSPAIPVCQAGKTGKNMVYQTCGSNMDVHEGACANCILANCFDICRAASIE